jgi:hypothetical protein
MTKQNSLKLRVFSLAILAGLTTSYFIGKSFLRQLPLSLGTSHLVDKKVLTALADNSPQVETASQISPDGTKNLTMKITHNSDKTLTYDFTATEAAGNNAKTVYVAQISESEKYNIPFNTWSPDDKYFFIVKDGNIALVFRADGEPVVKDKEFFNIPNVFGEKVKDNTYKETTGWASNTLLIVNSVKPDGAKGPSYWFEVPSQAVIQLSSQF